MSKAIQWIILGLAFIAINIPAILLSVFSLFGTAEGTSVFSVDYLIAGGILLLANLVIIQLFITIRKGRQQEFIFGLCAAVLLALGLYLIAVWLLVTAGLIIAGIGVLAAIVLLVKAVK